ncbi:MAG: heme ABC transporter permease CcmC [Alphaproteobacteria bacterium]
MLDFFANPNRFKKLVPWLQRLSWLLMLALIPGLLTALIYSPPDYQQGQAVRLMYVHVPAAWWGLSIYGMMAISALMALAFKHPLAGVFTRAAALPGLLMTLLCLISGSFWGKPMWGAWWVWDARLSSMALLGFLYMAFILLPSAFQHQEKGLKMAHLLLLVGAINLPIIRFSVNWWATLHQPASLLRAGGTSIHPSMLWPLFLMSIGFGGACLYAIIQRMNMLILQRKIDRQFQ